LLWAGRIAFASERSGQGQLKIEQAVVAAVDPLRPPVAVTFVE
jgi:hypothetical protein